MSRYAFESTVNIMIVTGEDQGLYGSTAYAQWAVDQGMRIDAVITNDVVGNIEGCENPSCPPGDSVIIDSTSVRHFSGTPDTGISRQLSRYMKLKALEYVSDFTINLILARDRPGRSGDHVPFYNRGYAGVRFTEAHENGDGSGYNGRQHNEFDLISDMNTNAGYMANIAKINIAGIASLALAPETPGGLETSNVGDGSSVILSWPAEQSEPDFAGYRIAVRPEGRLFYTDIVDAGEENEYTLTGLTEGQMVYLSISAYDTDENESVFSEEISFTPAGVPLAPENLDATSEENGIQLDWVPNNEMDMELYGIYRMATGQGDPELISTVPHPVSEWYDDTISPHILYTYYVTAIDADQNESGFSNSVFGQLATHDNGIIIIDGTLDGSGGPLQPTDDEVDDYYDVIFSNFNIGGYWDIADSNSVGMRFSDAHLASFSVAVLHSDRLNAQHQQDTTALRKYLDNGGSLFLSGWNLSYTLAGNMSYFTVFPPGSFFREYLKVDSLGVSEPSNQDFVSASSLMPSIYPDLVIDSAKVPIFDHRLLKMEAFLSPLVDEPVTEPLYVYESSLGEEFRLHGEPVGLRHLSDDLQLVVFDVPLYFIQQEPATVAARQALTDLGEIPVGIEDNNPSHIGTKLELYANYPNPFNAATIIRYSLPENSYVTLSVYNRLGQRVAALAKGIEQAGVHIITWDATDFPSGFYFARLE
ncbi:MAG: M28 family peptidase, partial [candidate division Zixibacteria bacterium]